MRIAGGYRLSGRWSWASGIDHFAWIAVSAIVPPQSPSEAFACGFALLLLGPALGITRGVYQFFVDWMKVKAHAYTGVGLADHTPLQIRIAESAAEIDAAALVIERAFERMETVALEELTSIRFRARIYRDYVLALQMLVWAVNRMFGMSGARFFLNANPMRRYWRDIHAIAAHVGLTADPVYETFGRLELGLPLNPRNSIF